MEPALRPPYNSSKRFLERAGVSPTSNHAHTIIKRKFTAEVVSKERWSFHLKITHCLTATNTTITISTTPPTTGGRCFNLRLAPANISLCNNAYNCSCNTEQLPQQQQQQQQQQKGNQHVIEKY